MARWENVDQPNYAQLIRLGISFGVIAHQKIMDEKIPHNSMAYPVVCYPHDYVLIKN